jgi:anti-sigma regulatory factor (Ser/Thr protein kinase)
LSSPPYGNAPPTPEPVIQRWPQDPSCVPRARHGLRAALGIWGLDELTGPAELVLSELLGNAVRHTRHQGQIETRYRLGTDAALHIEVHDPDPDRLPLLQPPNAVQDGGRGLHLVQHLTDGRWGCDLRPSGKTVWADLRIDDAITSTAVREPQ